MAEATASEWALGLRTRSRALLTDGEGAQEFYEQSIAHLGRTGMRAELARARLLYGEWLAREGLSNPEIVAGLYISGRTAGYHLSKVFTKLGITSRTQLEHVLT
jgi:ATP/maltotriose-dependent transcriptional regulator MalT